MRGLLDVNSPDAHYDYRGAFLAGANPADGSGPQAGHWPDTFKQHGHPTFSVESQYSRGPSDGGHWLGDLFLPHEPRAASDATATEGLLGRFRKIGPPPQGPPTQGIEYKPFADSLQTALGVKPTTTRLLGKDSPERILGLTTYNNLKTPDIAVAPQLEGDDLQRTYAHELGHLATTARASDDAGQGRLADLQRLSPPASQRTRELIPELIARGWEKWSGRPGNYDIATNAMPASQQALVTPQRVDSMAAWLKQRFENSGHVVKPSLLDYAEQHLGLRKINP
jgi:hypothetical protein